MSNGVSEGVTPGRTPSADHSRHDRLLVVRYLDRDDDLLAGEVSEARALIASCPDCAALGAELQLIADRTSHMVLPARPRDFRLTPEQAASLRPGGMRRFLESLGAAFRFQYLRPLAGAAVAIGLLLAVVGSVPMMHLGASAAVTSDAGDTSGRGSSVQLPTAAPVAASPANVAGMDTNASPLPTGEGGGYTSLPVVAPAASGPPPVPAVTPKMAGLTPGPTPTSTDYEMNHNPTAAPASGAVTVAPATGGTTAVGPCPTPEAGGLPQGNAAVPGVLGASNPSGDQIPPLAVLGALLAMVGLVVLFLTVVARRIGRSAG